MTEKKITVSDYGLYITSFDVLSTFLKDNKIRSKKTLAVFQKNHSLYLDSLANGVWIPIVPIDSVKYIIKVNEFFNDSWICVNTNKDFNLKITQSKEFWIGSFSNLLTLDTKVFSENDNGFNSYETLDGVTIYDSFKFNFPEGNFLVTIKGFKRKKELDYPEANYGFHFNLKKIDAFDGYKDPREDEKYNFNIAQM